MKRNLSLIASILIVIFIGMIAAPSALAQNKNISEETKYWQRFEYIYDFIQKYYIEETTAEQLYEGAIKGMLESLDDPYSYYLTDEEQIDLTDTATGEYAGVGLIIQKPDPGSYDPLTYRGKNPQYVEIVAPIEDGPSYRAGIHAGDYISKIDGESVVDLTVEEVKHRLRGNEGTKITYSVVRGKREFETTVKREIIEVPTVKYVMLEGPKELMKNEKIGFIRIIQFTALTADKVKEAILNFKRLGYTALIIDVRGNPGGLLSSVVDVADLFLSEGPIVTTKSRIAYENEVYLAHKNNTLIDQDIPIAVLINRNSASASEILAGALKDTGRGVLVGETTYGKASVQQPRNIGDASFKLTIARYFTPNDINIDKIGVEPNIEAIERQLSDEEQELLDKLFESQIIENYIDVNKDPSPKQISSLISNLKEEGYYFEDRILRRLIMQEVYRYWDFPPIYDLDYDVTLQAAVEAISNPGETNVLLQAKH